MTDYTKIQIKRGTAAEWTSNDLTLALGQQGWETDTLKMKVGDGSTAWTSLAYFNIGLTQAEVDQLANIGSNTISATQWGYLGVMDQNVRTSDNVTFGNIGGTLTTSAQANITSLGTLTGLTMTGNIVMGDGNAIGQASGPLLTFNDTSNYLGITGGDIGIGTSTPNALLEVAGNALIGGTTQLGKLTVQQTAGADCLVVDQDGAATALSIKNAGGSYALTVDAGNVGIGTTTPANQLSMYRDTSSVTPQLLIEEDGAGDASAGYLLTGTAGWAVGADGSDSHFKISNDQGNVGNNVALTITNTTRYVGIGTASPNAPLEVAGNALIGGTTQLGKLTVQQTGGADCLVVDQDGAATALSIKNSGGSYALTVDAGNVGIGTITPATSALLELSSTTGALLVSRMTTTEKNALTAVNGMIVYDVTLAKFQGYEGGAWTSLI